jgi:hypothetical protein
MRAGSKHTQATKDKISATKKLRACHVLDRSMKLFFDKEWAGYLSLLSGRANRRPGDFIRDAIFYMMGTDTGKDFFDTIALQDIYRNTEAAK